MVRERVSVLKGLSIENIGNRINLAGNLLMAGGLGTAVYGVLDSIKNQSNDEGFRGAVIGTFGFLAFINGEVISRYTQFGKTTLSHYLKTKKIIEEEGRLNERWVELVIEKSENLAVFGYCQLQGVYLAARETGQLETFNNVKNRMSRNLLPNF